jgi:hypothetical protein
MDISGLRRIFGDLCGPWATGTQWLWGDLVRARGSDPILNAIGNRKSIHDARGANFWNDKTRK